MQLNPFNQCKQYNIPIWQCPSFLFLLMGIVNITSIFTVFFVAQKYTEEPELVALIVIAVSVAILIISHLIVSTFAQLAETNRIKTEFLNIVSHQILTPLTSEKWLANLLLGQKIGPLNSEQKNYLELLKASNIKSIKLVNNLLDVSRIESNRMVFEKKPFDLKQLTKEVLSEESYNFTTSKISSEFMDQTNGKSLAFGDTVKTKLVIQNFISNAIKYTKENGQIVVILKEDGNFLKLSVIDNGVGIPAEEKPYIFQKFFRSSNAMRFQTLGSGLGLYLSKYIIDMLGGKIGFESEENKGSNFWFKLPAYNK